MPTIREEMRALLAERPATARDLSQLLHIREKDVAGHLAHLERSLQHRGERLVIEPAECLDCRFAFRERTRLTRPGSCPRCRGEHIAPPRYRIERR